MKKEKERYCPKCGSKLLEVREDNEKDFYTSSLFSIYTVNRKGDKYSSENGKRMFRTEWHCPVRERTGGLFSRKEKSHYIFLEKTDLTD